MVFDNQSKTQQEHAKNFVLYYLAHLKNLLQSIAGTLSQDSLSDTASKLDQLWLLEQLPALQQGIMPLGDGEFEIIHANRMRVPPRVTFSSFTGPYEFEVTRVDEISTRFAILDSRTGQRVLHPVPMGLEIGLDAEL